jgi:hypothetical protein
VIRELLAAHPQIVSVLPQDGRGIGAARNIGLAAARGEFIQFLDSDDLLMPEKFARQVAGLRAHPECGISYCATREYRVLAEPTAVAARRSGEALTYLFPALLRGRIWPAPSPLYRRSIIEAIGLFSHSPKFEDWDYEARAGALKVRLHHCAELLADKRDAHHVEGRRKGGVPFAQAAEHGEMILRVYDSARLAGVGADELAAFAERLFAAGRLCAAAGAVDRARRLVEIALQHAPASRQWRYTAYRTCSDLLGWRLIGRVTERSVRAGRAAWKARRRPAAVFQHWRHRWRAARLIMAGQLITRWPGLLTQAWHNRRSRRQL